MDYILYGNYYWSERFIARNKTERPCDEPPTDQEHRRGDRADQAHRAQLIARSIISFGCLSLVKSVFVFVYCFSTSFIFNGAPFSYRNRTPHLYENGSSYGYSGHINIGSSAPDWPGTVQKHSDTSTTLKNRLIG